MPTNHRARPLSLGWRGHYFTRERQLFGREHNSADCGLGPPVAAKAKAAKRARLVYRMLRYGMKYTDTKEPTSYDAQYRKLQVTHQAKSRPARLANH